MTIILNSDDFFMKPTAPIKCECGHPSTHDLWIDQRATGTGSVLDQGCRKCMSEALRLLRASVPAGAGADAFPVKVGDAFATGPNHDPFVVDLIHNPDLDGDVQIVAKDGRVRWWFADEDNGFWANPIPPPIEACSSCGGSGIGSTGDTATSCYSCSGSGEMT